MTDVDTSASGPVPVVGPLLLAASGELDVASSEFVERLQAAVAGGASTVVVDLLDVTFIDSSVVNALVVAAETTRGAGGWLRVVYTHHLIRRVIEICGLTDVLPQYATRNAAVRGAVSAPPSSER